jgi:glutamyl-tRNA reductase
VSVLVVGLSHKSAPVAVLERAAVSGDTVTKLLRDVVQAEPVAEAFVVSTCNRVEVYADVDRFHAGVTAICELLARHCGVPSHELTQYLYVHYEDRAVSHLLAVAAGLDSMVVGEDQILGQVRSAVKLAAEHGTAGRVLGELGRLALRTGKRARAETAIGRAGLSLLSAAVELAAARLGPLRPDPAGPRPDEPSPDQQSPDNRRDPLAGRDVLVVGAGSMSGLATATAARSGAASITVANRTRKHAERLAASVSTVTTTVTGLADLPAAIAAADVVISCTGAAGQVITGDMVSAALAARTAQQAKVAKQAEVAKQAKVAKVAKEATATTAARGTLVIMDLAMPRDVEAAVADLPGVVLIGMDQLSEHAGAVRDDDVAAVRTILEAELAAYQSAMDAARVAPTVVALRTKAAGVVDAELARLAGRLSADDLSGHALDEIAQSVRRVVDKLLHAPTVRVKELAGSPGGEEYAAALRVLFDLDPRAVEAVTRAAPEQEGSR